MFCSKTCCQTFSIVLVVVKNLSLKTASLRCWFFSSCCSLWTTWAARKQHWCMVETLWPKRAEIFLIENPAFLISRVSSSFLQNPLLSSFLNLSLTRCFLRTQWPVTFHRRRRTIDGVGRSGLLKQRNIIALSHVLPLCSLKRFARNLDVTGDQIIWFFRLWFAKTAKHREL